jgi:AAA-like domain/CHAT domain
MYDLQPHIVHFSGHGVDDSDLDQQVLASRKLTFAGNVKSDTGQDIDGLVFENEAGQSQTVSGQALAKLFKLFDSQVTCVLLNACYSENEAREIVQYVPYVIGMNQAIGDEAARQFAQGFYRAIWADRSIEDAFASGVNAIELHGIPEGLTPVLLKKSDLAKPDVVIECPISEPLVIPQPELSSPTNDFSLENPEGLMRLESGFYIHSVYEKRCFQEIAKPNSLIRIKSPNNMGKSSLMLRILNQARQLGYRTVTLDLRQANKKFFDDYDKLMQWFCASIGKQLRVPVKIEEWWDDACGSNDSCVDYFQEFLLEGVDRPLVVAIDNFDRVFEHPDPEVEVDFCGLLRGLHEGAKTKELWNNLRLVIVHSQESYAPKDINQSPFNVGLPIELEEFTLEQVQELVKLHKLEWKETEINQLMSLIGGHPYLVRTALYHIAVGDITLNDFLRTAATESGIYSKFLTGHLNTLENCPELEKAIRSVVISEVPIRLSSKESFKLISMGLVTRTENDVQPRCVLYRQYFRDRLGV